MNEASDYIKKNEEKRGKTKKIQKIESKQTNEVLYNKDVFFYVDIENKKRKLSAIEKKAGLDEEQIFDVFVVPLLRKENGIKTNTSKQYELFEIDTGKKFTAQLDAGPKNPQSLHSFSHFGKLLQILAVKNEEQVVVPECFKETHSTTLKSEILEATKKGVSIISEHEATKAVDKDFALLEKYENRLEHEKEMSFERK